MDGQDPGAEAWVLLESYVAGTGYDAPRSYSDLLLFVELSRAPIFFQ